MAEETLQKATASAGTTNDWNAWDQVAADDGSYADAQGISGTIGEWADWPRFEVPYAAKITGIEIGIRGFYEPTCTASKANLSVTLSNDSGASYSAAQTITFTNSETEKLFGNSGFLWPKTAGVGGPPSINWSPDNFNNQTDFWVRVQAAWLGGTVVCDGGGPGMNMFIDYMWAKVHFVLHDHPHPEFILREHTAGPR